MIALIKKHPLTGLLAVSLIMLLANLGQLQTNIMEARNIITAREMVASREWIFTTINNLPRYEKPPLPTWLTAISGSLGGFDDLFFLRLPSVLVTLLMVFYFYRLLKYFYNDSQQASRSALILITSFYIFFAGRDNQWDIYCHAFMVPCIYYLVRVFSEPAKNKYIMLSGLFFGLSFLSKGPISPYALFLPFIIAYLIVYRNMTRKKLLYLALIFIGGLAIGLAWPLYVRYADPVSFHAITAKEAGRWASYNTRPWYYYWNFFAQSGIWTVPAFIGLLYPYMKTRVKDIKAYQLSFLWAIFSVLLLSLIPEKKPRYLLPVLIPLAMNTGFYIEFLLQEVRSLRSKWEHWLTCLVFGITGLVAFAVPVLLFLVTKEKYTTYLFWITACSAVSILSAVMIFYGLGKRRFSYAFYGTICLMCGVAAFGIPVSKAYYSNSKYYSAKNIRQLEKKYNVRTYELNGFIPEVILDYGASIPEINPGSRLTIPKDKRFGLVLNRPEEGGLKDVFKGYSLKKLATIDLNNLEPGKKRYNEALVKAYYLVEKENP